MDVSIFHESDADVASRWSLSCTASPVTLYAGLHRKSTFLKYIQYYLNAI